MGVKLGDRERMKELKEKAGAEVKQVDDLWWKIILISSDRKVLSLARGPRAHSCIHDICLLVGKVLRPNTAMYKYVSVLLCNHN